MLVRAPAKINLTLEILARRVDGYHTLRSVMLPVALYDDVAIDAAERFSFRCDPAALTDDNLVVRALARIGRDDAPVAVSLRKRIPVGAGLGGGSSDAAAILRAAMTGAFGAPGRREWIADARALGSDIPFFLAGTGALVEGTGERITAIGALPAWWIVLIVPPVHVDTAAAYAALAAERERRSPPARPRAGSASLRMVEAIQRADYATAIAQATNDFEPLIARTYPPVAAALAALRRAGAQHAMLSGSGGATFSLCANEAAARELVARVVSPDGAHVAPMRLAADSVWRAPAR